VVEPALFSLDNVAGSGLSLRLHGVARQSATAGARYAHPLEAVVRNAAGRPVQGTTVTFSLGSGGAGAEGGSGAGATFVGGSSQATAVTNARGVAVSPLFTAGSAVGGFTATASVTGVMRPVTYNLDSLAARLSLRLHGVARQSATAGVRYAHPLEAVVRNAAGRPVQGTTVTFSLGSGAAGAAGGSGTGATFVGGSSQATAVTNARGVAVSPLFTAGSTAGRFTATASVTGVMRPVAYNLDCLAARSPSIASFQDPPATARIEARFTRRLRVRIVDGSGRPVASAAVTFSLGAGGSSDSGGSAGATFAGGSAQANVVTRSNGVAVSPPLTANGVAGSYAATASSTAAPGAVTFALRNVAGEPAAVTPGAASGETTAAGTRFPVRPAVAVTDAKGNAVAGALVTFSAPARRASGKFAGHGRTVRVRTDIDGIAVAPAFVANGIAGGYALRASVPGARPTAFALVNL
jgi:hypothetical protein